jgi:hypothetical protein
MMNNYSKFESVNHIFHKKFIFKIILDYNNIISFCTYIF